MNQQFEYLVLDEAHCIKNSSSSRFSALNAMDSSNRLLLSGTPVQNDLVSNRTNLDASQLKEFCFHNAFTERIVGVTKIFDASRVHPIQVRAPYFGVRLGFVVIGRPAEETKAVCPGRVVLAPWF